MRAPQRRTAGFRPAAHHGGNRPPVPEILDQHDVGLQHPQLAEENRSAVGGDAHGANRLSLDIMDRLDGARGKAKELKRKVRLLRWRNEIDPVFDDLIRALVRGFEDQLRILFTAALNRHSP